MSTKTVLATIALAALGFGATTSSASAAESLRVQHAMQALAGRAVALDCTYAARTGAPAETFPDGGPSGNTPTVFAKPWVCAQARRFTRTPNTSDVAGVLILAHESLHARKWAGARDEQQVECEALREVGMFATMLGAPAAMLPAIQTQALVVHAETWSFTCA